MLVILSMNLECFFKGHEWKEKKGSTTRTCERCDEKESLYVK